MKPFFLILVFSVIAFGIDKGCPIDRVFFLGDNAWCHGVLPMPENLANVNEETDSKGRIIAYDYMLPGPQFLARENKFKVVNETLYVDNVRLK